MVWCDAVWCYVMWHDICGVMWHVIWCGVMWRCMMSCHVMWVVLHILKCSLDRSLETIYISVLLVLHNRQYGTVDVQSRRTVTLQSAVKMFIALYDIMRMITVFIRLYFDQINFSPQNCHTSYVFKLHFNIILLHMYKYTTCSTFSQLHTWETLFFCERTHISMFIFDHHESEVSFQNNAQVQLHALWYFL